MDAVTASSSYSPSVSPCPTVEDADTAARFSGECGVDRMVKIELEAAETLAALARSTESETSGGETRRNGKESVSHRVENELTADDSVPMSSDLDQDQEAVVQQHYEKKCDFMSETVKTDRYAELKPNPNCTATNASSGGCKSRQNLTEAEKESRKLRRVLANRESARQTIRRRQAFYEELTRKASDLALENENLKREKELATKEYDTLKSKNDFLKAQMTKLAKAEEIREESKPNNVDASTSASITCPIFIYSQPSYSPFLWPSIVRPSNSVHPQAPMGPPGNPDSYYVLPFPLLFHLPHTDNGSCSQPVNPNDKQHETRTNNQCSSTNEENHHSALPVNVQTEASTSTEPIHANHLRGNLFDFPPDGGGSVPNPAQTLERENNLRQESSHGVKANSPTAGDAYGLPEKYQSEPVICRNKKVDVVAAAVARKRRKELTRLKNLHLRLSS